MNTKQREYKGYNGFLILTDKTVMIKRGIRGILLGGGFLRGDKTIPYSSIAAIQLKRAGLVAGYIQLTLIGGSEAKGGLIQSTRDENTINFHAYGSNNKKFEEAKRLIEGKITNSVNGDFSNASYLDDIEKLAKLKDKGIITEQEFKEKKKKLLNL